MTRRNAYLSYVLQVIEVYKMRGNILGGKSKFGFNETIIWLNDYRFLTNIN